MLVFLKGRIAIIGGDITALDVDMIVNAANAAFCGGGGVDGAIHDAAGPELLAECRTLGAGRPGDVKVTRGYALAARHIAHAVGPVWQGGEKGEDGLLATCYRRALELAIEHGCKTIAFPSISTGAFRFPVERATRIALTTVGDFLVAEPRIERATFCCFDGADERIYKKVSTSLFGTSERN